VLTLPFDHPADVHCLHDRLYVCAYGENALYVVNLFTLGVSLVASNINRARAVTISADNGTAFVLGLDEDYNAQLWSVVLH
jgi:hypothetical protein